MSSADRACTVSSISYDNALAADIIYLRVIKKMSASLMLI